MEITDLLSNPLVWGLLAWLFSRFFMSNKKEEETTKKQPSRPQNHQDSRQHTRSRSNPKPIMTTVEHKSRQEGKPSLQTVQQAFEKMKERTLEQIDRDHMIEKLPKKTELVRETHFPKVDRKVKQNNLIVDRTKAVQGIIWSEILGPPRSKNPHYTQNRRHS